MPNIGRLCYKLTRFHIVSAKLKYGWHTERTQNSLALPPKYEKEKLGETYDIFKPNHVCYPSPLQEEEFGAGTDGVLAAESAEECASTARTKCPN
jgi:hypothetical protein